jgi:hypothetical protein
MLDLVFQKGVKFLEGSASTLVLFYFLSLEKKTAIIVNWKQLGL